MKQYESYFSAFLNHNSTIANPQPFLTNQHNQQTQPSAPHRPLGGATATMSMSMKSMNLTVGEKQDVMNQESTAGGTGHLFSRFFVYCLNGFPMFSLQFLPFSSFSSSFLFLSFLFPPFLSILSLFLLVLLGLSPHLSQTSWLWRSPPWTVSHQTRHKRCCGYSGPDLASIATPLVRHHGTSNPITGSLSNCHWKSTELGSYARNIQKLWQNVCQHATGRVRADVTTYYKYQDQSQFNDISPKMSARISRQKSGRTFKSRLCKCECICCQRACVSICEHTHTCWSEQMLQQYVHQDTFLVLGCT